MTSGKRAWQKPELIVLVRGRSEEAVLGTCKEVIHPHSDPGTVHGGCLGILEWPCFICSLIDHS